MIINMCINNVRLQPDEKISHRMEALAEIDHPCWLKPLGVSSFLDGLKSVPVDPVEHFID